MFNSLIKNLSLLLSLTAIPISFANSYSKTEAIKFIHSPDSTNKEKEFVYIAGNPILLMGKETNDVKNKFELSALFASTFRKDKDSATFLFYRDPKDTKFKERMDIYAKAYRLKDCICRYFTSKHDIVKFFSEPARKRKINGILFFTHSYPFGLNLGVKTTGNDSQKPLKGDEKKRIVINDPQYLYIENLGPYISKSQLQKLRKNITKDTKIFIAGCKTHLNVHLFKTADINDVNGYPYIVFSPDNYLKEIRFHSFAQRLSNLFGTTVLATQFSTHFEISDDGGKTFRNVRKNEISTPGKPIIMVPDKEGFSIAKPIPTLLENSVQKISLRPIPHPPYSPLEKYGESYRKLSGEKRELLNKTYLESLDGYKRYMKKYNFDYEKLPDSLKVKYEEEYRDRDAILNKLLDKERKYQLNKSISIEAINWYRWHFGLEIIMEKREKLGLPSLKIIFTKELEKDSNYFLGGVQYTESENFTDFLDL